MNLRHALAISTVLVGACAGSAQNTTPPSPGSPTQTTAATVPLALEATPDPSTPGFTEPAQPVTAPAAAPIDETTTLSDGQIARIAQDIDNAEIEAARLALSRGGTPRVRDYAMKMLGAHSSDEQRLDNTLHAGSLTADDSSVAQRFMTDSQAHLDTLRGSDIADFDHSFMAAQISALQDALSLLDGKLIPNAKNPQLKTALEATRQKVIDHIKMAQDVQATLSP
jgi:putative membrane protein